MTDEYICCHCGAHGFDGTCRCEAARQWPPSPQPDQLHCHAGSNAGGKTEGGEMIREKQKPAQFRRSNTPAGRTAMPAKVTMGDIANAVDVDGRINADKLPQVVCPRCGGLWFAELAQYRLVPPEVYAPEPIPIVGSARPFRRIRVKMAECVKCRQLVELPGEGG